MTRAEKVYTDAIELYGVDKQTIKAIEEMAELTQALCRRLQGEDNRDNLAEEIADVAITQQQLEFMYPDEFLDAWQNWFLRKLVRLESRIAGKKRVVVRRVRADNEP